MTEPGLLLVVRLWIAGEDVAAFEAFERQAAAVMARHGGRIEHAVRCARADVEAGGPFEVHLVRFPDAAAYDAYRADAQALAAQRGAVIARTEVWRGTAAGPYGPPAAPPGGGTAGPRG